MKTIKKILAHAVLLVLLLFGFVPLVEAAGLDVTFNPVPYTSDRYPELTGTVTDPTVTVDVFVNNNGVGAEVHPDGTWIVPHFYTALDDGTYDIRVEAINELTHESATKDYPAGLVVHDDYTMAPVFQTDEMDDHVDNDNVGSFVVKVMVEQRAFVHVSVTDEFDTVAATIDSADSNGNLTFAPIDLSDFWDGWITFTAQSVDESNNYSEESSYSILKNTASLGDPSFNDKNNIVTQQNQKSFPFLGMGTPGGKIYYYLYNNGAYYGSGSADADSSGKFSKQIDLSNTPDGFISMYVGSRQGEENSGMVIYILVKDTVGPEISNLNVGTDTENGFKASFSGKTDPNTKLKYSFKKDDKTVEGEITSDEGGDFVASDLDLTNLSDGEIFLNVQAEDENGNTGSQAEKSLIKKTVVDNNADPGSATDTEVTTGTTTATQSGVTVTAANAEESSETSSLPVTGPNSSALLVLAGLTVLAGIQVGRLKKD